MITMISLPNSRSATLIVGRAIASLLAFVIILAASIAGLGGTVAAQDGDSAEVIELDSCTTIDEPGEYVLTADIMNTTADPCIAIQSSDVLFDGQGYTIDGINQSGAQGTQRIGIHVTGASTLSDVTVEDVTVTDWGIGIFYDHTTDGLIRNTDLTNNEDTIVLGNSTSGTLTENTVSDNAFGPVLQNASESTVRDNTLTGNLAWGVLVKNGVDGSDRFPSSNIVIRENTVTRNQLIGGVFVANSTSVAVVDNRIVNNPGSFAGPLAGTTIEPAGVVVANTESVAVIGNTIARNSADGVYASETTNTAIILNTITESQDDGIDIQQSVRTVLALNALEANGDQTVEVTESRKLLRADSIADLEALLDQLLQ